MNTCVWTCNWPCLAHDAERCWEIYLSGMHQKRTDNGTGARYSCCTVYQYLTLHVITFIIITYTWWYRLGNERHRRHRTRQYIDTWAVLHLYFKQIYRAFLINKTVISMCMMHIREYSWFDESPRLAIVNATKSINIQHKMERPETLSPSRHELYLMYDVWTSKCSRVRYLTARRVAWHIPISFKRDSFDAAKMFPINNRPSLYMKQCK